MKKLWLLSLLALSAGPGVAQQISGSFDGKWEDCFPNGGTTKVGVQPAGWGASNVYQVMSFKQLVTQGANRDTTVADVDSCYSAHLLNYFCGLGSLGATAPAYITLGDAWNYGDYANLNTENDKSDGGAYGGVEFAYRPDSISLWVRRVHQTEEAKSGTINPEEKATVLLYSWKGSTSSTMRIGLEMTMLGNAHDITMVDRDKDVLGMVTEGVTKSEDFELVATSENYIEGDYAEWTKLTFPINYVTASVPEKLNIVIASADYFNRPNLGVGNTLDVDDVELIYNSQLATLTYDGETVPGFAPDSSNRFFDLSTVTYDRNKVDYTSNGAGATVETHYDSETARLTLTVKGNDYEIDSTNVNVYKIQFKSKNSHQLLNSRFNGEWEACTPYQGAGKYYTAGVGEQPVGWKSSNIYQMGVTKELVSLSDGAVYLHNGYVGMLGIGQNAPGYISLGTPWNAAKALPGISEKDGGSFGGLTFTSRPDSIRFSYKRSHGKVGSPEEAETNGAENMEESASVVALLWRGEYSSSVGVGVKLMASPDKETMIDREKDVMGMITEGVTASEDAECIATINHKIEGDQSEWATLSIPFSYTSDAVPEKINVIFSSADYFGDRDAIGAGNSLTIDDVVLVYNSQLATLTYDGETVPGFAVDNYEVLDLSSVDFEESKLAYTSNGAGATVETSYDKEKAVLTLTVKGNDYEVNSENEHIYKVQFKLPVPVGIDGVEAGQHNGTAYDLQGRPTSKDSKGILIINGKKVMKK